MGIRRVQIWLGIFVGTLAATPALAQYPQPLTPAWLAARAGGASAGSRPASSGPQSAAAIQQSMLGVRKAAQVLAAPRPSSVSTTSPNGLVAGWLSPDASRVWQNVAQPIQTQAPQSGRTTVTVRQSQKTAVAYWKSFNVGSQTDLMFDQTAAGSSANTWVVLNRVTDTNAVPSQILGSIKAQGQVYIINRNGVIFGSGSQVNTASLLVTTLDFNGGVADFLAHGIYSQAASTTALLPAFAPDGNATSIATTGAITVMPGAQITTLPPTSSVSRGGFVLLMGSSVSNAGAITAPNGQIALVAGRTVTITPGYSSSGGSGDPLATTLGMQIAVNPQGTTLLPSDAGVVTNNVTGMLTAATGDVTMVGETVAQNGIALSSTTTGQRGTIHLLTPLTDRLSSVTLGSNSLTMVVPDTSDSSTALNSQLSQLIATSATNNSLRLSSVPLLNNVAGLSDRLDQSRIEISAGGLVNFQNGSLTIAQAGQIAVAVGLPSAAGSGSGRIYTDTGATLDVSGVTNLALPLSANLITVNIQSNEVRDSPGNRLSQALAGDNVMLDINSLTVVAATTAYPAARSYTAGGLLEVSGYVANIGHTVGEWSSVGGNITFSAPQVVTQPGSVFNLAGGSIAYQADYVPQTWLISSDGQLHNVNTAPGTLTYNSIYSDFTSTSRHWHVTDTYTSGIVAPSKIYKSATVVGRDAGSLILSTPSAVFGGSINAGVTEGPQQTGSRPAAVSNPFLLSQGTASLAGSLSLGHYNAVGLTGGFATSVALGATVPADAEALRATTALPADATGFAWLPADVLNGAHLGALAVTVTGPVSVAAPLSFAPGASVSVVAPTIDVAANLTLPSGSLTLGNKLAAGGTARYLTINGNAGVTLEAASTIDMRGTWTNLLLDRINITGAGFANGGSVSIDSSKGVSLLAGSRIDVSAGGTMSAAGKFSGGKGGSVSITADDPSASAVVAVNPLVLDGTLIGFGAAGAGTLKLTAPSVWIGNTSGSIGSATLALAPDLFRRGFANYQIVGQTGVTVAPGTTLDVVAPGLQQAAAAATLPTGSDPSLAYIAGLQPLFSPNPRTALMTQRVGASVSLSAVQNTTGGAITVGEGATIRVDPGQSVGLTAYNSITVLGSVIAPGGSIAITNTRYQDGTNSQLRPLYTGGLAIWIGNRSLLDVAGLAATALDQSGKSYGIVQSGGLITIGGVGGLAGDGTTRTTAAQVVIRPGAVLDASGAQGQIETTAGIGGSATGLNPFPKSQTTLVSGNGGSISLSSYTGIFTDGALLASGGSRSAAGGSLSLTIETPVYDNTLGNPAASLLRPAELVVSATPAPLLPPTLAPGDATAASVFARAYISAAQISGGGFGSVALNARGLILFDGDVTLRAAQSITLNQAILAQTGSAPLSAAGTPQELSVLIAALYVKLGGLASISLLSSSVTPVITNGWQPSTAGGTGLFTVRADQIDVSNDIRFGTNTTISLPGGGVLPVAFKGFSHVTLESTGGLRFLNAQNAPSGSTTLITSAGVVLKAAQIYPASGVQATVIAGLDFTAGVTANALPATGMLTIAGTGTTPAPPLSIGGSLTLAAGTVRQGGTVIAPEGSIILGAAAGSLSSFGLGAATQTSSVTLLPDSITSVSASGLTIPYGGTSDTISYTYNGGAIGAFHPDIVLAGESFKVVAGATLDLRGGGTLTGGTGELLSTASGGTTSLASQGFVSGRGGSTDVLVTPLLQFSPSAGTVKTPSLAANPVYAIVAGAQSGYAPVTPLDASSSYYGSLPKVGATITVGAGVPGLAAGTYTLLPSYYALLPGGYRVELASASKIIPSTAQPVGNGTYLVDGYTGTSNTAVHGATATPVYVTPAAAIRTYSQYNEENFSTFLTAQAVSFNDPRPILPKDAGTLILNYVSATAKPAPKPLVFDGTALFAPATGGYGGTLSVTGSQTTAFEITGTAPPGSVKAPSPATGSIAITAAALDAIGAPRLVIGGTVTYNAGTAGSASQPSVELSAAAGSVTVGEYAALNATEVFLLATAATSGGAITVRDGATINTIGTGAPAYDSASTGLSYDVQRYTALLVSNGSLNVAPVNLSLRQSSGALTIANGATLYAKGTIIASTENLISIGADAKFGAASINLSVPVVNIGLPADPSLVPTGLTLQQSVLDRLLSGNVATGVSALTSLSITASSAVNIHGSVNLNTGSGSSGLAVFVLNTPAIYGSGSAGDSATISTGTLVWNGVAQQSATGATSILPSGVITGGAGSGHGSLTLAANTIVLGYPDGVSPAARVTLDRTMFGFSAVNLNASSRIEFNNEGSLSIYAQQQGVGFTGTGGNLTITTPLLTAASGSQFAITAGGTVTLSQLANAATFVTPAGQGASLSIAGGTITANSAIVLPAGTISLLAKTGDISLGQQARLSVAGPSVALFDQTASSPGGSVTLESTTGRIDAVAGSMIDVSSAGAAGGNLRVAATGGTVSLAGSLFGNGAAGLQQGSLTVRALALPAFDTLITAADPAGFTKALGFDIGSGNLTLAGVRAHTVNIAASGGHLTVQGVIDASGTAPGSITLAAGQSLKLAASAVLDAHATVAQTDSTGAPIAAANRAGVSLTAQKGTLTLDPGSAIDVSNATGSLYGTVELYAPRSGGNSVQVSASTGVTIKGAQSIALYGMRTYAPANGIVTQFLLNTYSADSAGFINAAISNKIFLTMSIPGLTAYGTSFHLRPGVETDSPARGGTLTVQGDLDLSAMRYTSLTGTANIEPGSLILRAGGALNVFGSISDGFGVPADNAKTPNPDDNGWQLLAGREPLGQDIVVPVSVDLAPSTSFDTTTGATLNYAITINGARLRAKVVVPATVTLAGNYIIPRGGLVATANIYDGTGTLRYSKGHILDAGTKISSGWKLAPGSVMPFVLHLQAGTVWPAGAPLSLFQSQAVSLSNKAVLQPGGLIPAFTNVVLGGGGATAGLRPTVAYGGVEGGPASSGTPSIQGRILATAPLLIGNQSWSIQLAGGADLASADTSAVQGASVLAASGNSGNVLLSDPHYVNLYKSGGVATPSQAQPGLSVIRTGTGDLSLVAGGNVVEASLFGIYTAGTQSAGTPAGYNLARGTLVGGTGVLASAGKGTFDYNSLLGSYSAWYPTAGGNVRVIAQGTVTGDVLAVARGGNVTYQSDAVGNWLWRQGGSTGQATAWWINFGAYADSSTGQLELVGFTGIGALGGGNVTVAAGGNAGNLVTDAASPNHSTAIGAVIASTGQVSADNTSLTLTGGGNLTVSVGGTLNPANTSNGGNGLASQMFGVIGNLRGTVAISAESIGRVVPSSSLQAAGSLVQTLKAAAGGPLLVLGDATVTIATKGDLVLGGVIDPGRVTTANTTAYATAVTGGQTGGGRAAFTLWQQSTSINLYSAGGTLVPSLAVSGSNIGIDMNIMYPPTLIAVAATGNITYAAVGGSAGTLGPALELAPSATGQLALLAGSSIDAAGLTSGQSLTIDISGAPASKTELANPFRPAFQGSYPAAGGLQATVDNVTNPHDLAGYTSLFAFQADTANVGATALHARDTQMALIYAAGGNIVDLGFGETWQFVSGSTVLAKWYIAAKPANIRASNDILVTGTPNLLPGVSSISTSGLKVTRDLILNVNPGDVSTITAGRDIFYANAAVAGPGTLEVTAGRNLYQANQGSFYSVGEIIAVSAATQTSGAGVTMLAGVGSSGPDWTHFLNLYFNPANQADAASPLSSAINAGKVVGDYAGSAALFAWMKAHFGFTGTATQATAAFKALPVVQQTPFLLQAYFAELSASASEYNTTASLRYHSYLRGDEANTALWGVASVTPSASLLTSLDAATASAFAQELPTLLAVAAPYPATAAARRGDITLYGGSGITTQLGGVITTLAPYGQIVLGLASVSPPAPANGQPAAGLIAADTGDVNIYTHDSLILGQSRGFAIGGNLSVWAATGDISVGVGSKTTTVFQAPRIDYDNYGDITLAPVAPTSGAGLATLSPTPDVPVGAVVLATRFGVIDLGEAGVRSSGNIVIAGKVIGTGGLSAAGGVVGGTSAPTASSAAATSAPAAASPTASSGTPEDEKKRRREIPSLITVEVVSFGGDGGA